MFESGDLFHMPVQNIYIDSLYPGNPAEAGLLGDRLVARRNNIDRMGL